MAFVACDKDETTSEKLIIQTTLENKVVDVEKYVNIPEAIVVDKNGSQVEQQVKVKIYNPEGGIVSAWTGDFRVPYTGVWKVVYSSSNADDYTISLTCQDLSAPEYTVKDLARFVKVGDSVDLDVFSFCDYSGVNQEQSYITVQYKNGETWTNVEYTGTSFVPAQEGYYKVIATATDNIGKQDSYEFMLLAVTDSYTISELQQGYVASYDASVYEYLIASAGEIDGVSGKNDPIVSYVGEVAGALNGSATKATVFKGENGATLRLTLPKVNAGSLDNFGDNLTLRFKGESKVEKWYVNGDKSTENIATIGEADVNGWQIMNIPLSTINNSAYNVKSIEFVLGSDMKDIEDWYFDFVKMSHILQLPRDVSYSYDNQELSWLANENATGYEVSFGGNVYNVTESNIEVPVGELVKIKVLGDTANYLDSVWSNEFTAINLKRGYISEYNNEYFESTIKTSTDVNTWWAAGKVESSYVASGVTGADGGDAIKTTMQIKTSDNVQRTAITLNMPTVYDGTLSSESVKARIKIDHPTARFGELWWNGTPSGDGGIVKFVGEPDKDGWIILDMPITRTNGLYGLDTLTMGFLEFAQNDSDLTIYIDWVRAIVSLEKPTNLNYDNVSGKLSWEAVANATGYVITYDNMEYTTSNNFYQVPTNKVVTVKAIGTEWGDSDWSMPALTMHVQPGYVVDFNDTAYEYYIESGVYSSFWKADAVSAKYVESGVAGADGGDAMKVTVDIAQCRENKGMSYFVINFLANKGDNIDGNALQIRFRATYNDGADNVDPFLYVINGTDAVINGLNGSADVISINLDVSEPDSNGWRILSIPTASITGGVENMTSLGIAFYQYVGVDDGIGEIYLDYVKVMKALDTPSNLKYTSGNVTWDAVENATYYVVKYDGNEYTTTATSYAIVSGKSVSIKAVGEGFLDSVWSSAYLTINTPTGYIADYNNAIYEDMIANGYGDSYWLPNSITTKYTASGVSGAKDGDALVVTMNNNNVGYSSVTLNLPAVSTGSLTGNTIQVRYRLKEGAENKTTFLYTVNGITPLYNFTTTDDSDGWKVLNFTVSDAYSVNSIGIAFYGLAKNGVSILELDYVKVVS